MKTLALGLFIAYVGVATGQDDSLAGSFFSGMLFWLFLVLTNSENQFDIFYVLKIKEYS